MRARGAIRRFQPAQSVCGGLALAACLGVLPVANATAQATGPSPAVRERFQAGDRNRDGKLDREEYYRVIVEGFYFRDKGKKGYLTIKELHEASPRAFGAANRKGDGRLTLDEYANALFADFDAADVNRDGMLGLEELEAYPRRPPR
jgi:hypothetical protein